MLKKIRNEKIKIVLIFLFDILLGIGLSLFIFIRGITPKYDLYILLGYFILVCLQSFFNILSFNKKI